MSEQKEMELMGRNINETLTIQSECDETKQEKEEENDKDFVIKINDKRFLDLGWGLHSIDIGSPYTNEYNTLIYSVTSFVLAALSAFVDNYIITLLAAIFNTLLQIVVFAFCVYKYYQHCKQNQNTSEKECVELHLSDSMKHYNPNPKIVRSTSISPLSSEYNYKQFGFDIDAIKKSSNQFEAYACTKRCFSNAYCQRFNNFLNSFDVAFGREDDPICIRPYYFRFLMVLYGIITSIYILFVVVRYHKSPLNVCATSYAFDTIYPLYNKNWVKPDYIQHINGDMVGCTRTVYVYDTCILLWLWWIVFSLFDLYELTEEYYKKVTGITDKVMKSFPESRIIGNLRYRVEQVLYKDIELKMKLESNIRLYIGLIVFFWLFMFFWKYYSGFSYYFAILMFSLLDAIFYANISMTLIKICILSKYPVTIANIFGEPIYCETSDDLLAWWQLRHIFKTFRMKIFIKVLSPVIFYGFIGIIIVPFWAVLLILSNAKENQDFYIYPAHFSTAAVLITIVLYCMKQFVRGYDKQTKHIGMLKKEVIRLKANQEQFAKKLEELEDLIKLLTEYMAQFDKPIHITGIPMTNGVFTLLRGVLFSFTLLIIEVLFGTT